MVCLHTAHAVIKHVACCTKFPASQGAAQEQYITHVGCGSSILVRELFAQYVGAFSTFDTVVELQ
jgi:hypothetical protein